MVDWDYYDKFDRIMDRYLPAKGEGDTLATQIVTAVTKLVYKWYNDGDVYDNTGYMSGWCNDLSSYANWLFKYAGGQQETLLKINEVASDSDYEDLLKELADNLLTDALEALDTREKQGCIYECEGPFRFQEYDEIEDDEDWEDEEDDDEDC